MLTRETTKKTACTSWGLRGGSPVEFASYSSPPPPDRGSGRLADADVEDEEGENALAEEWDDEVGQPWVLSTAVAAGYDPANV